MNRPNRLKLLQRQVAWQAGYTLTLVEDLEEAARAQDARAACHLLQAFAAACFTLSQQLWPGGRRLTDQLSIATAFDLRQSLEVSESSLLFGDRLAPLGITIHFTEQDCEHFFDVRVLAVEADGELYALGPLIGELRSLWSRAAAKADRVPSVG